MENQKLEMIIQESGLEKTKSQLILDKFSTFIKEAGEWENKAKTIVITDILQIKEMANAREARLALKSIRVNAENVRKELKEQSLRESKAIDGIANVIKALIVPIEEYLEKQEKFAENLEKERIEKRNSEREVELLKYTQDISLYNYKEMSDEVFTNLILSVKKIWETEQEAIKKTEDDRIAKIKANAEEQERIKIENETLKIEAEAKEKELAKERAEQEKKLEAERAKARLEAEAREKIEKELKAKKEIEEKTKKDEEIRLQAEKLAKLEAEKKAELAPDREKLIAYAVELGCVEVPKLQTKEAKETLAKALKILSEAINLLKSN